MKENSIDIDEEFLQISNYCHGVSHNTMGVDRMLTNPEFKFSYDIINWLEDSNEAHLSNFKLQQSMKISFQLTDEQFKSIQDTIEMFGNTKIGRSKAMRMIAVETLWRRPIKLVKIIRKSNSSVKLVLIFYGGYFNSSRRIIFDFQLSLSKEKILNQVELDPHFKKICSFLKLNTSSRSGKYGNVF